MKILDNKDKDSWLAIDYLVDENQVEFVLYAKYTQIKFTSNSPKTMLCIGEEFVRLANLMKEVESNGSETKNSR